MTDMLYPFLYAGGSGLDTLMEDVRRSTAEKVRDIVRLREAVLEEYGADLADCAARMADAFRSGGRLFTFGNGGSSTDAQDVAALFLNPGGAASPNPGGAARPLPALALTTDVAVVTALSNDVGFEVVFARQLAAFGRPGDIALALSTSGNSDNLIAALRRRRGGDGDGRPRRIHRRADGGAAGPAPPVRRPVVVGAPDPGGADDDLPRAVGADAAGAHTGGRLMCLAIPGEIVEIMPDRPLATVDVTGVRRAVNIALLDGERLAVGDWVLIHVGFAMSRIDEAEAKATLRMLEGVGAAYDEEIDALRESGIG